MYGKKLCYSILSDARDAYELSFVAVPAQRESGITKSFGIKEKSDMVDIIKAISDVDTDVTITKSQAEQLSSYIDDLKEEAKLGEEYKKQLSKEVVKLFATNFPQMDTSIVSSVTSVMTTKELLGFKQGLGEAQKKAPQSQLISKAEKNDKKAYSEFKI
jgi:superfamily I DNA/RNA helicase